MLPNPDEESRIFRALVEAASRQARAALGLDNAWRVPRLMLSLMSSAPSCFRQLGAEVGAAQQQAGACLCFA